LTIYLERYHHGNRKKIPGPTPAHAPLLAAAPAAAPAAATHEVPVKQKTTPSVPEKSPASKVPNGRAAVEKSVVRTFSWRFIQTQFLLKNG
jgi:hypothetical protein